MHCWIHLNRTANFHYIYLHDGLGGVVVAGGLVGAAVLGPLVGGWIVTPGVLTDRHSAMVVRSG